MYVPLESSDGLCKPVPDQESGNSFSYLEKKRHSRPCGGECWASAEGSASAVLGSTHYCLDSLRAKDLDQGTPYKIAPER